MPDPASDTRWRLGHWLTVLAIVGVALGIARFVATVQSPREWGVILVGLLMSIPAISGIAAIRICRTSDDEDERREHLLVWLILTFTALVGWVCISVWSGAFHPGFR